MFDDIKEKDRKNSKREVKLLRTDVKVLTKTNNEYIEIQEEKDKIIEMQERRIEELEAALAKSELEKEDLQDEVRAEKSEHAYRLRTMPSV